MVEEERMREHEREDTNARLTELRDLVLALFNKR